MDTAADEFQAIVTPWLGAYDRLSLSAYGVRLEGVPVLLTAALLLTPSVRPPFAANPMNGAIFWGLTETRPFSAKDLVAVLKEVVSGSLSVGGITAALPNDEGRALSSHYVPGMSTSTGDLQAVARAPQLRTMGSSRHSLLYKVINQSELDWHVRSLNPPFTDLNDVHVHFGLPTLGQTGDSTAIDLVARPPAEIRGDSVVSGGKLHLGVHIAKQSDRSLVSVGYKAVGGKDGVVRGQIQASEFAWSAAEPLVVGNAVVDIRDAPTVECFLNYAKVGIQRWWVVDPQKLLNPRFAIHAAFDPKLEVVSRFLFEVSRKDKDVRVLEDGVAMLLSMLGFSVTQHGRSQKLSDAPDIVAVTPSGNVSVVECTIGLPDQDDQVAKVLQRTEVLRRSLSSSGWSGAKVLPIVVSALSESEIQLAKREAEGRGVLVVASDDLRRALDQTRVPTDPERLFQMGFDRLRTPQFLRS